MNKEIIQQYINAAILHMQFSIDGDHSKANKQYKILNELFNKFKNSEENKAELVNLLEHEKLEVQGWAAAHLLGLKYEEKKAEKTLLKLTKVNNQMISFDSKMTLKKWKEQGYLKF